MRFFVLFILSCLQLMAAGQKKYHCQYNGKISFAMPDSTKQLLREQMEEKGSCDRISD